MELIIYIKMDFALNILQKLIYHETESNQTKPNQTKFAYYLGCFLCLIAY